MEFTWDENKASANLTKHGVSFQEAAEAFSDPHFLLEKDREEGGEQRWHILGYASSRLILLLVAHHYIELEDHSEIELIRIISAREATPHERKRYENGDT